MKIRRQWRLRARRGVPRIEGGDDPLRVPHEEEQIEVDAAELFQLQCAKRIVGSVDDVTRARRARDRQIEVFVQAPVSLEQPASNGRPLVQPPKRRGAVNIELRLMTEKLLSALYVLAHAFPKLRSLLSTEPRHASPRQPRVELAGKEHILTVPERDAENGTATTMSAQHVDHLRPHRLCALAGPRSVCTGARLATGRSREWIAVHGSWSSAVVRDRCSDREVCRLRATTLEATRRLPCNGIPVCSDVRSGSAADDPHHSKI